MQVLSLDCQTEVWKDVTFGHSAQQEVAAEVGEDTDRIEGLAPFRWRSNDTALRSDSDAWYGADGEWNGKGWASDGRVVIIRVSLITLVIMGLAPNSRPHASGA